jgi:hypothetical protein
MNLLSNLLNFTHRCRVYRVKNKDKFNKQLKYCAQSKTFET